LAVSVLAVVFFAPASGRAEPFSPEILKSVVSLLPEWPGLEKAGAENAGRPKNPEGTAVAVLPGGYLATNVHVIGRATSIKIRLEDGRILPADIIGRSTKTDIALIKAPIDLPVPVTGPEPALGARVCAVGNQFGLGLSVTCGVVSALRRTGTGFNPIEDFIQTDATINPGGSGGALVDGKGRLVGMISAIFTKDSDANIGVNFASSIKLVMRVVGDLKERGGAMYFKAGFSVRDLTLEERKTLTGAAIRHVAEDGPGAKAGLEVGDIITAIGDRAIRSASDVATAVFYVRPGGSAEVEVLRGGEKMRTILKPPAQ